MRTASGYLFLVFLCVAISGCAGIKAEQEYGQLRIYSYTSHPITLETTPKTAFIDVAAPSGIDGLKDTIASRLRTKGMSIVDSAEGVDLVVAVLLSDANQTDVSASDLRTGSEVKGWSPGALLGRGISGILIDSWLSVGTLKINAQVTVLEKRPGLPASTPYFKQETLISVKAQRTNLTWQDCSVQVNQTLANEIVKLF